MSAPLPPPSPSSGKLATVAAVATFTVALSGYFMGLLQTGRSAERVRADASGEFGVSRLEFGVSQTPNSKLQTQNPNPETPRPQTPNSKLETATSSAPVAPRYRDLARRTLQPNHGWHSQTADLARPPQPQDGPRTATLQTIAAWTTKRTARRAFDGAPPTVPHPVDQQHSSSCLSCHGQPTRIASIDVPQLSHPPYTNCLQCHAPSGGPSSRWATPPPVLATPALDNGFTGRTVVNTSTRAYPGAPPTVPHATWMRQNCLSCHGPGGSSTIKTSHPTRQNCVQCHALDASQNPSPNLRPLPPELPPPPAPVTRVSTLE